MILHVTHNDMDGAGCAVLLKKFLDIADTVYLNYDEIDGFLIKNYNRYNKIVITDLSPTIETAHFLKNYVELFFIDHHMTSLELSKIIDSYHDTTKSATLLTYEWLQELGCDVKEYKEFAEVVNDYDMWHLKIDNSLVMNMFFSIVGIDRFVARFLKKPSIDFDDSEKMLLEIEEESKTKYLDNGLKNITFFEDVEKRRFAVIFAEKYNSELGHHILKHTDAKYVFIINAQKKKVSLRSKDDIDVSVIAVGNGGGGHKNAAGFTTDFDFCINDFLKRCGVLA
ncbi:MAG: phosphoesterase [Deferribacteraceae bacterium]|nr:phosphoesterase [Deferribacteraceae bacterium]